MATYKIGKGRYTLPTGLPQDVLEQAIEEIYATHEATRQGSLGYSVDNAQKMLGKGAEALGRFTGIDALENYGSGVVEQQEKDLAEGRYVSDYQGSFTDQDGVMNKLGWAGEKIVENLATSGVALGGSVAALAAAPFSAPAATLIGGATLGTNLVMSTGEAALEAEEKTGDYSAGGALATGGIVAFLDRFGAKIPKDKIANMTGKELVDELVSKGYTNAASELVKTVTKKAVKEGATEAAQENVIMTGAALQGADYNLGEVINKNIDSFVVGSGMGAGQSVASSGVKALVGTGDNVSGEPIQQQTAAATFAQRLDRIAKEGQPTDNGLVPFNLNDVDRMSDNGARAVMDVAHTRIATEIKELSKVLRDKLSGKERADFERELGALGEYVEIKDNDVVLSAAELRSSKNKTKSAITTGGYKAVERLVGDTREGQELLNLLRESQMLTSLHNKGYVGGLSQYTEGLNPFKSQAGYGDRSSLETVGRIGLSAAAGSATGGATIGAQLGAVGGARAVDAVTGSRSRVNKFVNDNQGGRPLTASGPSLREDQFQAEQDEIARVAAEEAQKQAQADADAQQQSQNAQETAEANRVAGQRNAPPTLESPQWTMETATGLDKNGVAMALRMLERMPSTPVGVRKAIDGYRKTIDTGGKVPNLSPLIRFVNSAANDNPQFIQRVAQPDTGVEQQQVQRDQTEAYKLTEGYRRGIAANQKAGSDLLKAMNADRSISPVIKAKLGTALTYLQSNLPKDPLGAIQSTVKELQDAGVSQELIQKYIAPYADRVAKQQPKPDVPQEVIEDRVVPVPYNNKRMQDAFGVTEPTLGGNYINLDDNNADVTGTSYTGGTVAIVDGKPVLETNNIPSDPATKDTGWKAKVNLFKKKAGWSWVDSPRTEETIVSTETRGKHHYSLATDFQTPVTLETYPNQKSEPRLRPSTYGEAVLGNKVGTISVRGKPHPVYDKVSIVPKGGELAVDDRTNDSNNSAPLNDPMRVSVRQPSQKGTPTANPMEGTPLTIGLPEYEAEGLFKTDATKKAHKVFQDKIKQQVAQYEGVKGSKRKGSKTPMERVFINHVKSNLKFIYDAIPDRLRNEYKLWYDGAQKMSQEFAEQYNLSLPQVAAVMALNSPQTPWFTNIYRGQRILDIYSGQQDTVFDDAMKARADLFLENTRRLATTPKKAAGLKAHEEIINNILGKRLSDLDEKSQSYFIRFYDEAYNDRRIPVYSPSGDKLDFELSADGTPATAAWGTFLSIRKSIKVLNDGSREMISTELGSKHKIRNFYNNILSPRSDQGDVTIDTHAVRAGLMNANVPAVAEALGISGASRGPVGLQGTYALHAQAYKELADDLGILPRELQSITWEGIRSLFKAAELDGNRKAFADIWTKYDNKKLSLRKAQNEIVKQAGGFDFPEYGIGDVSRDVSGLGSEAQSGALYSRDDGEQSRVNQGADTRGAGTASGRLQGSAQVDPSKQDSSDLLADEASPALAQATGPEVGGIPTPTKGSTSQDIPDPSKLELEEARDIITEISDDKPVRDMHSLTLLARAFNTDIAYVTNDADIQQLWQDYGITNYKAPRFNGSSNAFFIPLSQSVIIPNGNLVYRDGVAGLAVVKTGDLVDKEGIPRSAFHEVAHAISLVNAEIGVLFNPYPIKNPFNNTSVGEYTIGNTFVNFFYNRIREMSDKDRKAFIAEVKAVQDRTDFNTDVFPDRREAYRPMSVHEGEPLISSMTADNLLTENIKRREKELKALNKELQSLRPRLDAYEAKIRNNTSLDNYLDFDKRDSKGEFGPSMGKGLFDLFERQEVLQDGDILKSSVTGLRFNDSSLDDYDLSRLKSKREKLKKHIRKYQWNLREIVVDPIMLAISNPKQAKEVSPQFYKMLQEFFNSKDGPKFLSIILPMLMMLNMEDEEDERNMMAQGALSPQGQGALAMV